MDWDIGVMIYEPQDGNRIPVGPDGKKVGVFLLHGGVSDFKSVERIAKNLAGEVRHQGRDHDVSRPILFVRSKPRLAGRR